MTSLRMKSFVPTFASLVLITGFGAYTPAHAAPDCIHNPDAPVCGREPEPKPKPQPVPKPNKLNLLFDTRLERHQLGYWVHMYGKGFTPGSEVNFTVENLAGATGAKSIGIFTTVKADGTFSNVVWDGRTWARGGTANLRAIDKASGQSITTPIPALY